MLIRTKRGWELPGSTATDEAAFNNRRQLLKAIAAGPILAAGIGGLSPAFAQASARNPRYTLDRPITDEKFSTTYNNFYEFGTDKSVWREAQALKTEPWTI